MQFIRSTMVSKMSARAIKRLKLEIESSKTDVLPYYTMTQNPDNILEWTATIQNVPHPDLKDRIFHLEITCPSEYPIQPPKIRILDPHTVTQLLEYINTEGYLCIDILNGQWAPSWTLRGLIYAICSIIAGR